ncbi:MAG: hypothetical protein ABS81_09675 [Pseudonocardia sp. SCN 72-86]|nr:MAG: hypothetical protein ABS81_09675 [Pseudonocardia sp. SCN 72-86]
MDETSPPRRPLDGIVVLDLAHHLAGPTATRSLLDLGADVVKVEPPGGEPLRSHGPKGDVWMPSPTFLALHRDKLSIELDLKSERGRTALEDLARNADVVVENFRPGVTDRLGIGPSQLRALNPRLVYCSLNGFGAGGPLTRMATTDGAVQAFSGVLEMLSGRDEQFGQPASFAIMDLWAGSVTAQAILATLYQREHTGTGAYIDMTMVECALFARMLNPERGLASPNTVMATTRDGTRIVVQTAPDFVPRFFELLRMVPGCEDIADDPRFATADARVENEAVYLERIRTAIATCSADEWFALFMKAGVPASPVNTIEDALAHPQVVGRSAAGDIDVPGLGPMTLPAPPFLIDGHRGSVGSAPVELGVHNAEVMRRFAGYDDQQITDLFGQPR